MKLQSQHDAGHYNPRLQVERQGFDNAQPMDVDRCTNSPLVDDSSLVIAPVKNSGDKAAGDRGLADVEMKQEVNTGKKRRGRPPKGNNTGKVPAMRKDDDGDDGEDVCFICFDGGSLVLCDHRGCPKAYHPACIKREDAFFQSKVKWNCGWHICTCCQKASHFMCYLCPYSLCKGCVKGADYFGIRGNKGLCGTCMRTVMMIENNVPGDKETVQVDFDDRSSWEYLFKVYWVYLKDKLNLTLDEITIAENPWKGTSTVVHKEESLGELCHGSRHKVFCAESACGVLEGKKSKRRKTLNPSKSYDKGNSVINSDPAGVRGVRVLDATEWASKELLELVAHMKNGETYVLSQSDVHGLLLDYIKTNGLRDPSQECQILCDLRMRKLFGKRSVDQFEMQQLLESHFLKKEKSVVDDAKRQLNAVDGKIHAVDQTDRQPMIANEVKHEMNGKHDVKEQKTNANESAAVDFHNISLIYLPRNLMEKLIDEEKFHERVVGSVVRIKICSSNVKQNVHRLVQVIGTKKVAEPYKVGTKKSYVMLEILNLDKEVVISINGISDEEFSEDECRALHHSVISGLVKWWTVNEIKEKAKTLQALRVNDWLEAEILRVCHLRDQASENGDKNELEEYEEKLQLLNSPEERHRRLLATPEVHNNLYMHPAHCSKDGWQLCEKKQDGHIRPRTSGSGRKGRKLVSPQSGGDASNNIESKSNTNLATQKRVYKSSRHGRGTFGLNSLIKPKTQTTSLVTGGRDNQAVMRSESLSGVPLKNFLPALSIGMEQFAYGTQTVDMWHYQDPTGKVQGPFPMVQLQKWSASGHFPPDLRIWKINEKQDDSILLNDALDGCYHVLSKNCLPSNKNIIASAEYKYLSGRCSRDSSPIQMDNPKDTGSWNLNQNDKFAESTSKIEFKMSNGLGSNSSCDIKLINVHNSNEGQPGRILQGHEALKGTNINPIQPSMSTSLISHVFPIPSETFSNQVEDHKDEKNDTFQNDGTRKFNMNVVGQTDGRHSYEKQSDRDAGQSSGQNWRPTHISSSSNGCDSNNHFVSAGVSVRAAEQKQEIDFLDLPSSSANPSNGDSKNEDAESKHSLTTNVPIQISGHTWSTASSLVGSGPHLSEVLDGWSGYSHTPDKPLKPTELIRDHAATPTSDFFELRLSSLSHPTSNPPNWQPIVGEVNEFSPLADESVSDLLAEVEAMETLIGLSSPNSKMNFGGPAKHNFFDSVKGVSPAPDLGGDAMSSITSQSTISDDTRGSLQADVDTRKRSLMYSSRNFELEGNKRPSDASVKPWEAGSEITDANWGRMSRTNFVWAGLPQGNKTRSGGTGQATARENINVGQGTSPGNQGFWGSQRDECFYQDSGYSRGRP